MTQPFIKLSKLKPNPDNPRLIKDERFLSLVLNILKYPKFLEVRPIVHKEHIIQGGNMRLRALQHLVKMQESDFNQFCHQHKLDADIHELWLKIRKEKAVPDNWVADANDYNAEELKAFMIIDNVSYGENDWDKLGNEWNESQLTSWGLNVWQADKEEVPELLHTDDADKTRVSFEAANRPGATSDEYSVYEQLMLHENKLMLLEVLNKVKNDQQLEKLEDALMHIVNYYKTNHK